jgi:hypothetical protein
MTSSLYDNICFNRPIGSFLQGHGGEIMFGFVQHVGRDAAMQRTGCSRRSGECRLRYPLNHSRFRPSCAQRSGANVAAGAGTDDDVVAGHGIFL